MTDSQKTIILRPAKLDDADLLLRWRNDLLTRQNSIHSNSITQNEHLLWLTDVLNNDSCEIYIAEQHGIPVGTIRLEQKKNIVELSWTVAPEHRGKGIGKIMVSHAAQQIAGPISAKIKPTNFASIAIARHIGMRQSFALNGMLYFMRNPL